MHASYTRSTQHHARCQVPAKQAQQRQLRAARHPAAHRRAAVPCRLRDMQGNRRRSPCCCWHPACDCTRGQQVRRCPQPACARSPCPSAAVAGVRRAAVAHASAGWTDRPWSPSRHDEAQAADSPLPQHRAKDALPLKRTSHGSNREVRPVLCCAQGTGVVERSFGTERQSAGRQRLRAR